MNNIQHDHVPTTIDNTPHSHVPTTMNNIQHSHVPTTMNNIQHDHVPTTIDNTPHSHVPTTMNNIQHSHVPTTMNNIQHDHVPTTMNNIQHDHVPTAMDKVNNSGDKKVIKELLNALKLSNMKIDKLEAINKHLKMDSNSNKYLSRSESNLGNNNLDKISISRMQSNSYNFITNTQSKLTPSMPSSSFLSVSQDSNSEVINSQVYPHYRLESYKGKDSLHNKESFKETLNKKPRLNIKTKKSMSLYTPNTPNAFTTNKSRQLSQTQHSKAKANVVHHNTKSSANINTVSSHKGTPVRPTSKTKKQTSTNKNIKSKAM